MQARAGQPQSYAGTLDERWYLAREAGPSEEERQWAEKLRTEMEDLRGILAEGPVCFTSLGWLRQDLKRISATRVSDRQLRMPHLGRLREAHRWFALEAMTADDPGSALDALDALDAALSVPAGLIDSMVSVACAAMRDRAYARLALRGELPTERLDEWLAEAESGVSKVARAWKGERLVYWTPLGQDLLDGAELSDHFDTVGGVGGLLHGAADTALFLECLGAIEGHLRGTVEAAVLRALLTDVDRVGMPFQIAMPNFTATASLAVHVNAEHRLIRLGVLLARAAREQGRPPATEEEARLWAGPHAKLMAAGPWSLRLRYERLGTKRYRVAVDPQSPVPPILVGTTAAGHVVQTRYGEQPRTGSVLSVGQGAFEFEIR